MTARRVSAVAGDVSTDGLGLDDAGRDVLASCDIVIHSAATVSFDSPLDGAVEVNLLGPIRIAATLNDLGVTPHLVAVSTCYVAGNRRGRGARGDGRREPVLRRRRLAPRGRRRPPRTRRRRGREPHPRTPRPLPQGGRGPSSGRPARRPWPPRPSSCGRAGWATAWSRPGGPAPPRSAGPTPTPTPRPSASGRWSRRTATYPSASCGRRSSSRRWPNPALVGSAGSAWPSRSSSPTPGACSRSSPACPKASSTSSPSTWSSGPSSRWRPRVPSIDPDAGRTVPEVVQVASGSQNPLRYRRLVDLVSTWFLEHPLYDHEGQPIVVPTWSFPGRGRVQAQLLRAKTTLERAERVLSNLPLRGKQAEFGAHDRGAPRRGRAGPRLRRALRRLRRVRSGVRPRPAAGAVGRTDP